VVGLPLVQTSPPSHVTASDRPLRALSLASGYFLENRGQIARSDIVLYSIGSPRVAFEAGAVSIVFEERPPLEPFPTRGVDLRIRFEGADASIPVGREPLGFGTNFFLGSDPARWRTNVPAYREVVYADLYAGIDAVARTGPAGLKLDFDLRPGANPSDIAITYEGMDRLRIERDGVVLETALGAVRDANPMADQGGQDVPCSYDLRGPATVGFACHGWVSDAPWRIDPLVYATFLGGSENDFGEGIAVDSGGNACVAGSTYSGDFPTTPGAYNRTRTGPVETAYVAKLNPQGSALVYSTFLGGTNESSGHATAVDGRGQCSVLGVTSSPDFPIVSGFDATLNGTQNAFVATLSVRGDRLLFSTYLGGNGGPAGVGIEEPGGIAIGPGDIVCASGDTGSTDFPITAGAVRSVLGGNSDAFATCMNPANGTLLYSTYVGGTGVEYGRGLALDPSGHVWVTGTTSSADLPTTANGADRTLASDDAFAIGIDMTAGVITYGTFLGGSGPEQGFAIAIGPSGEVLATGLTQSADFPGSLGAYGGNGDAFLARLDPPGSTLNAQYLGGIGLDWGFGVAADPSGLAWVVGNTRSADFPTTADAFAKTLNGTRDGFVTEMATTAFPPFISFSTFLGGADRDSVLAVDLDVAGGVYVAGNTLSADFPVTPGAFDTTAPASNNAFVAKLGPYAPSLPDFVVGEPDLFLDPPGPSIPAGASVTISATVHNAGTQEASQVPVRFSDGIPPTGAPIDGDQVLSSLPVGGAGTVSVPWTAGPPGSHSLCVLADPDSLILESTETNNQACVAISVEAPLGPDLTVLPADVVVWPSPPYRSGQLLQIDATIRNAGTNDADPTVARFHDGLPPAPQIGGDQPMPSLIPGGSAIVWVMWTAPTPGSYEVCVVADPDDLVTETDETDNAACVNVIVSETRPDYAPVLPEPASPVVAGVSSAVLVSVVVRNLGNATPAGTAVIAFFNASSPSSPFRSALIAPVAPWEDSGRFVATWIAPAVPGSYRVGVTVDYGDTLLEWNEADNSHEWTMDVVSGPITTLIVGSPNYTASVRYVTSATSLSFSILDQSGRGIRQTRYRVDNGTWIDYATTGLFNLPAQGEHFVEWWSEDEAGAVEPTRSAVLRTDDAPPTTTVTVGDPKHVAGDTFVTWSTPLTLEATDGGVTPVGIARTEYRMDGGSWIPYTAPFALAGEGTHLVEYRSVDLLGNVEALVSATFIVDDTPPSQRLDVGTPRYDGADMYVTSATPLTLTATDGGPVPVGVASIEYRLAGSWTPYAGGFTVIGPDGPRTVGYRARDLLGNVLAYEFDVVLDNTPPTTTPSRADGTYPAGTTFGFTATDGGSAVARTEVRVDGGGWTTYSAPLVLSKGDHAIGFRSVDNVNNAEAERTLFVRIEGVSLPPPETNWKPLVAAAFASILALAGAWSARRAPMAATSRPGLQAFASRSLPFVILEAGTGVVSHVTGLLAIPPFLGAGTVVDVGILLAGITISAYRARRRTPAE